MALPKQYRKRLTACLSAALSLAVTSTPLLAIAQEYHPPQRGIPGRREGAGTRGTCLHGPKLLMALTPTDSFSTTMSTNPTFFWYVPNTKAQTAEFALLDDNDATLYKTTVPLSDTPGVVGFSLPAAVTTSVLTPGKDYHWQFSIVCNPDQPSFNPFVEGVVQRVKPSTALVNQLKKASQRERPSIYAAAGIWQDAIASIAQQRCTNPHDQDLVASWARLLESVQLSDFAAEPLLMTCPKPAVKPRP